MNRQQFLEFINHPETINSSSLKVLDELIKRYPYCQNGQVLYAISLYREENLLYPQQLKKAAAYAPDRRKLKELIDQAKKKPSPVLSSDVIKEIDEPGPAIETTKPESSDTFEEFKPDAYEVPPVETSSSLGVETNADSPVTQIAFPEDSGSGQSAYEDLPPAKEHITPDELLLMVRKRLAHIDAEKHPMPDQDGEKQSFKKPVSSLSKETLIDQFIQEEPRIAKPTTAFFSPSESAHRSNVDEEEIVSETLAQLYAKQGNISKAIQIYRKLSLLNQEKSRYFAAQIEKLST